MVARRIARTYPGSGVSERCVRGAGQERLREAGRARRARRACPCIRDELPHHPNHRGRWRSPRARPRSLLASHGRASDGISGYNRGTSRGQRLPRKRRKPRSCRAFVRRRRPESNRCTRLCRPLRSHSATSPSRTMLERSSRAGRAGPASGVVGRIQRTPGRLAQLGERLLDKQEVTGSSPVSPTRKPCRRRASVFSSCGVSWRRSRAALQAASHAR